MVRVASLFDALSVASLVWAFVCVGEISLSFADVGLALQTVAIAECEFKRGVGGYNAQLGCKTPSRCM